MYSQTTTTKFRGPVGNFNPRVPQYNKYTIHIANASGPVYLIKSQNFKGAKISIHFKILWVPGTRGTRSNKAPEVDGFLSP